MTCHKNIKYISSFSQLFHGNKCSVRHCNHNRRCNAHIKYHQTMKIEMQNIIQIKMLYKKSTYLELLSVMWNISITFDVYVCDSCPLTVKNGWHERLFAKTLSSIQICFTEWLYNTFVLIEDKSCKNIYYLLLYVI